MLWVDSESKHHISRAQMWIEMYPFKKPGEGKGIDDSHTTWDHLSSFDEPVISRRCAPLNALDGSIPANDVPEVDDGRVRLDPYAKVVPDPEIVHSEEEGATEKITRSNGISFNGPRINNHRIWTSVNIRYLPMSAILELSAEAGWESGTKDVLWLYLGDAVTKMRSKCSIRWFSVPQYVSGSVWGLVLLSMFWQLSTN